jgi:hypothetical protein
MENVIGEHMGMLGKRSHVMHPTDPLHYVRKSSVTTAYLPNIIIISINFTT